MGQAMGFFGRCIGTRRNRVETTTGLSVEERQAGNWRRGGYYDEDGVWRSHAAGLERVPYDGYAALLHEGERVLTAREARQADQGGGAQVTITGNTFEVRQESDIDAIAEALYRKLPAGTDGRGAVVLRLITFLEEAAGVELVLPVTPSSYQWAHEAAIETVTVDQLGDLNFFGGKRMGSTTLHDCLLPAQAYPFLSPGAGTNPGSTWSSWSGGWTGGRWCGGW